MDKLSAIVSQLTGLAIVSDCSGCSSGVVFGGSVPFLGNVLDNMLGLVTDLGNAGLVGLLVAGYLMNAAD